MTTHVFTTETVLEASLSQVFEFFSRAENLERLTPPWLRFHMLTEPPVAMGERALIDYTIRLYGVPIRWRTEIVRWNPPAGFVDRQVRGPFLKWEHEHSFVSEGDRTRMRDTVHYAVPGWIFAGLVDSLFVRRKVEAIFAYRTDTIQRLFGLHTDT